MTRTYLLLSVLFAVSGQLLLKWRTGKFGSLPESLLRKILFFFRNLLDPFILLALTLGLISLFCWIMAISRADLSYAYPFMGAVFVLIFIFSVLLFKEPVTLPKIIGQVLIVLGIVISSRSQ
ncbi:MAG: EamA family transporter [bacterium]